MARLLLAATMAAGVLVPVHGASACDPYRFPGCTPPCRSLVYRYDELRASSDVELPAVPHTGLAGCP
jgi:hypothetical protein